MPVLVLAGAVTVAPAAAARSGHVRWQAPAVCPDTDALRVAVERLLGESLTEGEGFEADARVTLDADARFTLELVVRSAEGEGTRTVRGDTCDAILNVAAFGIALALNPELLATATPPPEMPETSPAPSPPPPPPAPREPEPEPVPPAEASRSPGTPTPPPELWAGPHVLIDTSLLPNVAYGLGASVDLKVLGMLRFGVDGQAFVPQLHELDGGGGGGRFFLWSAGVRACWQTTLGVPIAACPTFQFGAVNGKGRDVPEQLVQRSWVLAPGAALLALPRLAGRVSGLVGIRGLFPLGRDVFVVSAGPVHQIPAFTFELSAGIVFRAF